MSSDIPKFEVQFTDTFKRQVRDLAKRYRQIKLDIQPILDQLQNGDFVGDQVQNTGYTVFKVRIKNSDTQRGKSGGYRLIYYIRTSEDILCLLIYSKSDEDNVAATEIKKIIQEFYN
ncbi:type II toxin-antitoxin system RelE/ParE family toxin [Tumidithrix elongata RA019]|uniref:Type II toxin-antitoxin system RelE/ParE family toxin n=1 Tax=Tumidithrix elongata BACA0141 TaxID=2716417 RepID=A0AAW9PVX9_9CYAN|nr:type II toxin-antitoxin system RelE/ParE family toxin [Tumidithrix elongata RA019]